MGGGGQFIKQNTPPVAPGICIMEILPFPPAIFSTASDGTPRCRGVRSVDGKEKGDRGGGHRTHRDAGGLNKQQWGGEKPECSAAAVTLGDRGSGGQRTGGGASRPELRCDFERTGAELDRRKRRQRSLR